MMTHKQRAELTFRDNQGRGRHGWVRLTPAYSVRLVADILKQDHKIRDILEPFAGTGTTGLVAGQHGLRCDQVDLNPFLVWLARVKTADYSPEQRATTRETGYTIVDAARNLPTDEALWLPGISNIERWWPQAHLQTLASIFSALQQQSDQNSTQRDLLLIAFCRLLIQASNAAFNHQSLSFKTPVGQPRLFDDAADLHQMFLSNLHEVAAEAAEVVPGQVRTFQGDSRDLPAAVNDRLFDAVITSPPYVNRMSYIRELRPYMYWLGYLTEARQAGELDWQAIGGTWGIATSRLAHWSAAPGDDWPPMLTPLIARIAEQSTVLSRYVHKYFVDMSRHLASVYNVMRPGGRLYYIVGNSKFYDTVIPAELLYAELMKTHGFINIRVDIIRKRNSKKELFEYMVSAHKPRPRH